MTNKETLKLDLEPWAVYFLLQVLKAEKEKQQAAHVKALSEVLEKHDKEQQDMGKPSFIFTNCAHIYYHSAESRSNRNPCNQEFQARVKKFERQI